jgi:hypothetical protein
MCKPEVNVVPFHHIHQMRQSLSPSPTSDVILRRSLQIDHSLPLTPGLLRAWLLVSAGNGDIVDLGDSYVLPWTMLVPEA